MDGCRKLKTDHLERTNSNYDGEWECDQCKPGYWQRSKHNEFCAPSLQPDAIIPLTSIERSALKECLERETEEDKLTSLIKECFNAGIIDSDKQQGLKEAIEPLLAVYGTAKAERDLIL